VVDRLVRSVHGLHLSRSFTTRARRSGEAADAYTFVDRAAFEAEIAAGGFLEWAEVAGELYGTPLSELAGERDVVLEIDVQGAERVLERYPDQAVVVLLLAPSEEVTAQRLAARGDPEERVRRRLELGRREIELGRTLASYVVVNDDVERAVAELADIVEQRRRAHLGVPRSACDQGA
jgi:guanylate kinase